MIEIDRVTGAEWRTSTFSDNSGGNCVAVAQVGAAFAVKDTKTPDAPPQVYTRPEWDAFVAGVKAGEFDY